MDNVNSTSYGYEIVGRHAGPKYAGLIIRIAAALIDSFIIVIVFIIPLALINAALTWAGDRLIIYNLFKESIVFILFFVIWLYDAFFTSSGLMATPGKIACGIKVVGKSGERITFLRAVLRSVIKYTPVYLGGVFEIFALVDNMFIIYSEKKQAVHDLLAETFVIYR